MLRHQLLRLSLVWRRNRRTQETRYKFLFVFAAVSLRQVLTPGGLVCVLPPGEEEVTQMPSHCAEWDSHVPPIWAFTWAVELQTKVLRLMW